MEYYEELYKKWLKVLMCSNADLDDTDEKKLVADDEEQVEDNDDILDENAMELD